MGINLGPITTLIHVVLVKSRNYVYGQNGRLTLNTEWDTVKFVFPYQAIVQDVAIYNKSFAMYKTVDEVYKKDATVFLVSTKYYGCSGRILDTAMLEKTKRIQSVYKRLFK